MEMTESDVLGGEFYCGLLQHNYDLLCKSLIVDKSLFTQLINKCHFNLNMIKDIKNKAGFRHKVQRLLDLLKTRIRVNPGYMNRFCICLNNVGQMPISKHFNIIIKRALEKRISEAKFKLGKKPGVFITNPYEDNFRGKRQRQFLKPVRVYRNPGQTPGGRPLNYFPCLSRFPQCTSNNTGRIDPMETYNILAFMVRRIDTQAKQIEDIKQRLRYVEIDTRLVKRTIGQAITGPQPNYKPQAAPALPKLSFPEN